MVKKDRLLKTFLELVQIDSPSGEEAAVAKYLEKKLNELGFKAQIDSYGNVIGKLKGKGESIMLNAHMDTVEPARDIKPVIDKDIIKTDGTTVLGGDPKAGVAAILEGVTSLLEDNLPHLPLELVFTRQEEIGHYGSANLNFSDISSKRSLVVDGEKEVNKVFIAAPGYNRVDLKITGRAAHAGVEPEKGISAIKIAAEIITQLEVGRIDEETTANIGIISGGSARNAVPETVIINAEIRSRNIKKLEKHSRHFQNVIDQAILKHSEAKFEFDLIRAYDPFSIDKNEDFPQFIANKLRELKLEPSLEPCGGGSDANVFNAKGIKAVIVGAGAADIHTTKEYVKISQMVNAAKFCEQTIKVS